MSQTQRAVRGLVRVSHQMTKLSAATVSQVSNSSILGVSTLDSSPLRTLEPKQASAGEGFSYYGPAPVGQRQAIGSQEEDIIGYWVEQPVMANPLPKEDEPDQPINANAPMEQQMFNLPPLPTKRWEETVIAAPKVSIIQESMLEAKSS